MGFVRSMCRRLASWVVSSKSQLSPSPSRQHGRLRHSSPSLSRRNGHPQHSSPSPSPSQRHSHDYCSSNGDMERSPSDSPPTSTEEEQASASAKPAQLGCVNRCQQLPVGRPGRTSKMVKIDMGSLTGTKMLKLGWSPSGTIRKGMWVSNEGFEIPVAAKIFHRKFSEEMIKQVSRDLKGQVLHHRNLLCPIGYCFRKMQLHLFYEYMVNGSLDQHLFTKESSPGKVLSWSRRCSVINGVAIGLHHLHSNGAVHGSIKCSNILLDQDMTARLGDFGYSAGLSMVKLSDITYLPPECNPETVVTLDISGPTLEKDVFFFGSVILEVVCGAKTSSMLVDWVWELHKCGNIVGAVDETVSAAIDFTEAGAEKFLVIALACSHPDPNKRPRMQDIINILAGTMPLVVPSRSPEYNAAPDGSEDDIGPDQLTNDLEYERGDRVSEWLRVISP